MTYRYLDDEPEGHPTEPGYHFIDLSGHPIIELANILAVRLMPILGPFCWAALVVFFLIAEFTSN